MKIIDEEVVRNKPVSDAYRDGWERVFGEKAPPASGPVGTVCPVCAGDRIVCVIDYEEGWYRCCVFDTADLYGDRKHTFEPPTPLVGDPGLL